MTEIDRIFDDSQRRMDAMYDELIAKSNIAVAKKKLNRIMIVCSCSWVACGVLIWLVNR